MRGLGHLVCVFQHCPVCAHAHGAQPASEAGSDEGIARSCVHGGARVSPVRPEDLACAAQGMVLVVAAKPTPQKRT